MSTSGPGVPSLRIWLQSTSLLAVVAGYTVLLFLNQRVADWQRTDGFRQTADGLISRLSSKAGSQRALSQLLLNGQEDGLRVSLQRRELAQSRGPVLAATPDGSSWLIGTVALDLRDGSRVHLRIAQEVSQSVRQEWRSFWLLVATAGSSCLFTSALLRLVLRRGLVQPLEDFGKQVQSIQSPPAPGEPIDVNKQPSELKPIAQAFNEMQQRLWESWEQQRIFTDGMAHELRTPITLISGHVQSLLRHGAPSALSPTLHLIRSEAERMTSLVSDLLDLARQDSQRLQLQNQKIQADDVLLQLFERMQIKAPGRFLLATGSEDAPDPPSGMGDPDRLQQCLTALVDNALRYGPAEGAITLGSSQSSDGGLILHVRDHGPGVREDEEERIFERFVRGSAASEGQTRGSGIGLAVVKLLMEAMGGSVRVCKAPGGGADFQLHLRPFMPSGRPPSA